MRGYLVTTIGTPPTEKTGDERDLEAVVEDLGTWRGFAARVLELFIYGLICLAEWLRPGMAREIARVIGKASA